MQIRMDVIQRVVQLKGKYHFIHIHYTLVEINDTVTRKYNDTLFCVVSRCSAVAPVSLAVVLFTIKIFDTFKKFENSQRQPTTLKRQPPNNRT
jgi:hypothetical protein